MLPPAANKARTAGHSISKCFKQPEAAMGIPAKSYKHACVVELAAGMSISEANLYKSGILLYSLA